MSRYVERHVWPASWFEGVNFRFEPIAFELLYSLASGTAMAEETIDPGLLEQTKNQIRHLVSEIADLADADIQPVEFHTEFLNRVVAAVAATGGALWMLDGRGSLKLQNQVEFRQTGLMDGKVKTQPHDHAAGLHDPVESAADHSPRRDGRGSAAGR